MPEDTNTEVKETSKTETHTDQPPAKEVTTTDTHREETNSAPAGDAASE